MSNEFSHGAHSIIYNTTNRERGLYAGADLVKKASTNDRFWFARWFYRHKIASLLFPQNFINVVAATRVKPEPEVYEYKIGKMSGREYNPALNLLYSKLANIPAEHATYSAHTTLELSQQLGKVVKASRCTCTDCAIH